MTLKELIELAAEKAGSKAALAAQMQKRPPRISEWLSGDHKPDAHEIAFMAELAGLPILQTVADIESQLDSRYAQIWRNALGKLTAAGVAATAAGMIAVASPSPANAQPSQVAQEPSVYYVNFKRYPKNGDPSRRPSRHLPRPATCHPHQPPVCVGSLVRTTDCR